MDKAQPTRRAYLRIRSSRLAALGFENYSAYVSSPLWARNRRRWYGGKPAPPCVCGESSALLHHKTYERLGDEAHDDLVAMCEDCHNTLHRLNAEGLMSLDPLEWVDAKRARENRAAREPVEERAKAELAAEWKPGVLDYDSRGTVARARRRAKGDGKYEPRVLEQRAKRAARKAAKKAA